MQYKYLGNTGIKVSELCLGTLTFGARTDEAAGKDIVSLFLDWGGNFIDTADIYGIPRGASEKTLGEALKGKRSKVVLTSKVGFGAGPDPNSGGLSRVHIMQAIEASLRRLQTDYLDLYYVHCWHEGTPLEETLSVLNDLVKAGKVRYLGASNFTAWQLMKSLGMSEQKGWEKFVGLQPQYNLLVRDIERELLPLCREEKLAVVVWSPLAGGFLSGKYRRGKPPPKDSRIARIEIEEHPDHWNRRATERNSHILDVVKEISEERGNSCAQIALAWILVQPGITGPIIGARTMKQLKENLGCIDLKLTSEELKALNEVSQIEEGYPYRFIRDFGRR